MRTIALSLLLVFGALAAGPETPYTTLAKLAADLSQNDAQSALDIFDASLRSHGDLQRNIESLAAQTSILCAIDVIEDIEKDGVHTLSVDWYLTLTLQGDQPIFTERRRKQVKLEMRQVKGKWKIMSLEPQSILDPVKIP